MLAGKKSVEHEGGALRQPLIPLGGCRGLQHFAYANCPKSSPSYRDFRRSLVRRMRALSFVFVAAPVGVAMLVISAVAAPGTLGFRTMVVMGGSMEPAFLAGDAVIISPAVPAAILEGDLITFAVPDGPLLTSHRVLAIKEINGQTYFQTKGDANASPDPDLVAGGAVIGVVRLAIPKVGYVIHAATTFWGRLFLVWVPLSILMALQVAGSLQRLRVGWQSTG